MTISSTTRLAGPFTGDGETTSFPFTFKVFEATDLLVETLNVASSAITPLALTTNYSVTLNEDQDSSPGGTITLTAALAVGLQLTITTDIPELQGLDLVNGGAFYPDVINEALDLLTVLIQQLQSQVSRSLQAPLFDNDDMILLPAAARAGKVLGFDNNGNPTLVTVIGNIVGSLPTSQQATGTVNGTNKTFTFTSNSTSTPAIAVFAAGVYQTQGIDYTVASVPVDGTWDFAFTVAPTHGPITVVVFG